ncbi:hypothetical protein PRtIB026_A29980 [Pseudomonas sp. RtIB026]|nr:hypothetical protein PRtIB026_A29980 [Pseudomonas sp. RtIB026]
MPRNIRLNRFLLTLVGVVESDPRMVWAAHYLSALAKALMDDAELGPACNRRGCLAALSRHKAAPTGARDPL